MILAHSLVYWALTAILINDVYATSLARHVFLPSEKAMNPFNDLFIQRVFNMDREKLYSIPPMNDTEFLLQLAHNDDSLGGKLYN